MVLVELVYEGGEVLDLCLEAQRDVLRAELRGRYQSVDLRGLPEGERRHVLQRVAKVAGATQNILVRGLSGLLEASQVFTRSSILVDALGKSELPARRELAQWAFRTKRVYVYSREMDSAIRDGGIGTISRYAGPFFPQLDLEITPEISNTIGVLSLGRGTLDVVGRLKRRREQEGLDFQIVTVEPVPGTERALGALDVATRSGLLVAPHEQPDLYGAHEAGILASCARRVLCAAGSAALYDLPLKGSDALWLRAEKYSPGSYVDCALRYGGLEPCEEQLRALRVDVEAVPRDILRRIS